MVDQVQEQRQDDLSVRVVRENITVLGDDEQPTQPVVATNIYRRDREGWRLLLHHASPEPRPDKRSAPTRLH